nr:hypothetical protein CFP56_36155 [Quercus suber]
MHDQDPGTVSVTTQHTHVSQVNQVGRGEISRVATQPILDGNGVQREESDVECLEIRVSHMDSARGGQEASGRVTHRPKHHQDAIRMVDGPRDVAVVDGDGDHEDEGREHDAAGDDDLGPMVIGVDARRWRGRDGSCRGGHGAAVTPPPHVDRANNRNEAEAVRRSWTGLRVATLRGHGGRRQNHEVDLWFGTVQYRWMAEARSLSVLYCTVWSAAVRQKDGRRAMPL